MLFRRRTPPGIGEKFRVWIWPRRSWGRSGLYVSKRIFRLTGSPHTIAAGVAAGVFASFTPFMGFHFLVAFALAYVLAGNMIAAALGTFIGNPLTFPFIWASTFSLGRTLLGETAKVEAPFRQLGKIMKDAGQALWAFDFGGFAIALGEIWQPLLKPMLFGGVPLGACIAIIFYLATRRLAIYFHAIRQKKLMQKAAASRNENSHFAAKDDMVRPS